MKIEDQVNSLDLAKRLKELGVKQQSYFYWNCGPENIPPRVLPFRPHTLLNDASSYSAFTAGELGELLGVELTDANESDSFTLKCGNAIDFWWATFGNSDHDITPHFENLKFADALAELLIHLVEEGLFSL
jgi:hypothetical protein